MSTRVRAELSKKNKYYISKHRRYELKHFCLQYPEWKKELSEIAYISSVELSGVYSGRLSDRTSAVAIRCLYLRERIEMVETAAQDSDEAIGKYILKAVVEDLSYETLKARYDIPCGKELYFDRYHKFFWLLDKRRE